MTHLVEIGGKTIGSGTQGAAIQWVKLTQCASTGDALTLGAVCADMVEISLLSLDVPVTVGTELVLYTREKGEISQVGAFTCQQVQTRGPVTKIVAYDSLLKLEKDLTVWLAALEQWPYTLTDFAHMVCDACGVTLAEEDIPGGNFPIQKFTGQGVTGRALMQYIGQAAGRFLKADATGTAHFCWYTPTETVIGPGGAQYYFADGLQLEEFQVSPVEKVQIRTTEADVGVVYPDVEAQQVYTLTGNPLLTGDVSEVAQRLYQQLQQVTYRPGQLRIPDSIPVAVGDIVTVADSDGQHHSFWVMERVRQNQELLLTGYGTASRGSGYSRNEQKFQALSGKVLELTAKVEGLLAENRDLAGNLARLSLNLEGISGQVAAQSGETTRLRQSISQIDQKADSISATVSQVVENGVSRVENAFGVTLDGSSFTIHREDSQVTNRLNEQGMYVLRAEGSDWETAMLRADADGVLATDVTVGNYLKVGDHTRFESYGTGRTACYYC